MLFGLVLLEDRVSESAHERKTPKRHGLVPRLGKDSDSPLVASTSVCDSDSPPGPRLVCVSGSPAEVGPRLHLLLMRQTARGTRWTMVGVPARTTSGRGSAAPAPTTQGRQQTGRGPAGFGASTTTQGYYKRTSQARQICRQACVTVCEYAGFPSFCGVQPTTPSLPSPRDSELQGLVPELCRPSSFSLNPGSGARRAPAQRNSRRLAADVSGFWS